MVLLNGEVIEQAETEMLRIVYELPSLRGLHGGIVERRMFFSSKGRAVVELTCNFDDSMERAKCIKLAKGISRSIKMIE